MEIRRYNFKENRELAFIKMLECQSIIEDNLESNGGTLRQEDILWQPYDWQHIVIATLDEIPIGFSLVRKLDEDKHNTGYEEYLYISVIAVKTEAQKNGVGTELLNEILSLPTNLPIVVSCRRDNVVSKHFLSKFMKKYDETRRYYRFLDNKTYNKNTNYVNKKR